MASAAGRRLSCSLAAAGIAWLISGIVFVLVGKGPSAVSAWLIWGTGAFGTGWLFVGLPLVAVGDKVLRINKALLMIAGGAGGVLVIELPAVVVQLLTPGVHFVWSFRDLIWPGLAFAIAAPATWLYRTLLRFRTPAGESNLA